MESFCSSCVRQAYLITSVIVFSMRVFAQISKNQQKMYMWSSAHSRNRCLAETTAAKETTCKAWLNLYVINMETSELC